MSAIRSNNLFVTSQLYRWMQWLAEAEAGTDSESRMTPDAFAEKILRDHILKLHPNIAEIEGRYWASRKKLDQESIASLKQTGTTIQTKPHDTI